MPNLAIFASGHGSNAEAIVRRFERENDLHVALVLSNQTRAGVLDKARQHGIPIVVTNRTEFYGSESVLPVLHEFNIDWVALAGFIWLVPPVLIQAYPSRIVNIHPALLPRFGGKGMYGERVHQAVYEQGERESGISIHYVDEQYDHGQLISQEKIAIGPSDDAASIRAKVLELEHRYYPEVLIRIMANNPA